MGQMTDTVRNFPQSGGTDGSIVLFNKEWQTPRHLEEVDTGILSNMFVIFQSKDGKRWKQTEQPPWHIPSRLEQVCIGKQVNTLCFSADGHLASGGNDGSIVLFDTEGQTQRRLEKVHGGEPVNTLCFSADGRLASGGADGSIVLFDKEGQTLRRLEKVHGGTQVKTLCFSADGRLASGVDDGRLISLEAFDVLPLAC